MPLDADLEVTVDHDAVGFTFTVSNADPDPIDLSFTSGKVADVAVFEGDAEVWRWSDGRMFTQAMETRTLPPDDAFTHEVTWDDPPSGSYAAEASLAATNVTLTAREPFEVP